MNTIESLLEFGKLREYRKNELKVSNVSNMETYRYAAYFSYKKDGIIYTDFLENNKVTTRTGLFIH
jgi:hypothetical protein